MASRVYAGAPTWMIMNDLTKPLLTKQQSAQFKRSKIVIRKWCDDRFRVGAELKRIRDEHLYREDYKSFEEFCETEYNWQRDNAYKLINASETKKSLPANVEIFIQNPAQANALAAVPPSQREAVIADVAKQGEVTAAAITEAAKKLAAEKNPPKEPFVWRDHTNAARVIPDDIAADWCRAEQTGKDLRALVSEAKCAVQKGLKEQDIIFCELHNTDIAPMEQAAYSLKQIMPYALCTTCHGKNRKKCTLCKGRGFISQFRFDQCVPMETKKFLEKVGRK